MEMIRRFNTIGMVNESMCDDIAQRTDNADLHDICSAIVEVLDHPQRSFLMEMIQRFRFSNMIVGRINLVETLTSDEIVQQIKEINPSDIRCPTKLSTSNTSRGVMAVTFKKLLDIMSRVLVNRRDQIVCWLLISTYASENIDFITVYFKLAGQIFIRKLDEFSQKYDGLLQYKELFSPLRDDQFKWT